MDARITAKEQTFVMSNDPKVIEFLEFLGINPINVTRVIVTVEVIKPVVIEVTQRAVRVA